MFSLRRFRGLVCFLALVMSFPDRSFSEVVVRKSTSYFNIGGKTAEELDRELEVRGPVKRSTGTRHPGLTEIRSGGEVTYMESAGRCEIGNVKVTLTTRLILPRWVNRKRAKGDLALIWDTLSADIKRHEERHAEIARDHARSLERTLIAIPAAGRCDILQEKVARLTRESIQKHDADQMRFDRAEAHNFDARMMRLLRYRIDQRSTSN